MRLFKRNGRDLERKEEKRKIEEKQKRMEFEQEPRVENKIETEIVRD